MSSSRNRLAVKIIYENGTSERLRVTQIGPNKYRLEESAAFGEVRYHDIIEAEAQPGGTLRFVRALEASNFKTISCVLSPAQMESAALSALLEKVVATGGAWEKFDDGIILVHVPPSEHANVVAEFHLLFRQLGGAASIRSL